jgi:hypothetical protein
MSNDTPEFPSGAENALAPAVQTAQSPVRGVDWRPRSVKELLALSNLLAKSDLIPQDYRGKPANVAVALMHGARLGFDGAQSVQAIAVINGRPSIWGDHALAVCLAHPACEDIIEYFALDGKRLSPEEKARYEGLPRDEIPDGLTAICIAKRRGREPVTRTFSVAQAKNSIVWSGNKKIPLWQKPGPWESNPVRMLQMRARGFALRDAFPDALHGLYLAEELVGIQPDPTELPTLDTEASAGGETAKPQEDELLERGLVALKSLTLSADTPGPDGQPGIMLAIGEYKGQTKYDNLNEARLRAIHAKCGDPKVRQNALIGLQRRVEALERAVSQEPPKEVKDAAETAGD